jgi:hypothetical protein
MGKRNSKITENGPISKGSTNQSKIQCKTVFSPQLRPGGAPKSEDVNRHANIHSSRAPQSLDKSELSGEADGVYGSNVEHFSSLKNAQELQALPSAEVNLGIEQIAVNVVCKARILIGLCENLKTWLELGDPIYKECKKEAYRYYWQDWWKVRREIENCPNIEQGLYERHPKIKEVFFQLKKLDDYLEFIVPEYGKYNPETVEFEYENPRKAIELILKTTRYVTSLLDTISPPLIPVMTSGGYTAINSSSNSAVEDGSVNAKTDDNSKAIEKLNSSRTPGKGVKRKISNKVPEKSRRLLHTLSLIVDDTGTGPKKTNDILKAIEEREKKLPEKARRKHRTHTEDIRILRDLGLIRKHRGSKYIATENGLKDVNRFKSDDQKKNSSEPTNLDWFTKKWHNNESDEGVGRK